MESSDSSPHYMRATSSSDAKKENSPQGGCECDDIISVSSSTAGSAINGHYAPKNKVGIKSRTNNKKTLINLGNVKSFRRRAKSRILQPIEMSDDSATSHHDSLVDASEAASPHYLKSTSCSEGKKLISQSSPRHAVTLFDSSDEISSHPSESKLASSSQKLQQTLSRTSSIRNVRILIKKSSFKPKRSSLNYSEVSEDVAVDRATYSSTLKDSKVPEPVELHPEETESERISVMKVCRYHHCSLHGHCREDHDPVPPPKRFLYKKRRSLKKQNSMMSKIDHQSSPGTKRSSDKKKNLQKSQNISIAESPVQETENDSVAFSGVKNEKGMDSYLPFSDKLNAQPYVDGYGGIHEFDLVEIAFGEMSFPERSYQESLNIMRKYSPREQEFGGTDFGLKGYCLKCSCNNTEQIEFTPRSADVDSSEHRVTDSSLGNGNNNEIPQNGDADVSDTHSFTLFKNPKKQFSNYVEDGATFDRDGCENKTSNKDFLETPVIFDKVTKDFSAFSSVLDSQTSADSKSELGELTTESTTAGDSISRKEMQVKDSEINVSAGEGNKLQFSKPRHISMWHLIHQHMASELATEAVNKPLQGAEGQNREDSADSLLAKESSASCHDFSDTNMGAENNSETQEIELRKFFAIKLVREAIEKILLPEVQDDQSVTSENIPQQELTEKKQSEACTTQESYGDPDADEGEGNVPSHPEEISPIIEDSSSSEMMKTETMAVIKSEKKAPKHWSNLKKWILLQRFIRELEKVRKFNPRKPQLLPLNPDPEAEKVNLRPQAVDERKRGEEWMLDYALRQAVNQLAPTQKRKVSLLVKAFETVVPPQEDHQIQYRIPRLNDNTSISHKVDEPVSGGYGKDKEEVPVNGKAKLASNGKISSLNSVNQETFPKLAKKIENLYGFNNVSGEAQVRSFNEKIGELQATEKSLVFPTKEPSKSELVNGKPSSTTQSLIIDDSGKSIASEKETPTKPYVKILQGDTTSDSKDANETLNTQLDRKNQVRMWHMIYQHVVSSIAEKIGSQLLEGSDDDETEDNKSPAIDNGDYIYDISKSNEDACKEDHVSSNLRSGFGKTDALKFVKEAVNEILVPESQDDSCDTQSDTSEFTADQEISEENLSEVGEPKMPKPKNWIKLKKLLLLKKSIKALEKARKLSRQTRELLTQMPDLEPDKIDLRRQMMDQRKKAEQWMLDYAVQHIVTKLTPARKRKVSMLVEAFEAVVPLPEM